jgi:pimeloyl-ACP methyl ester carboxylesterase
MSARFNDKQRRELYEKGRVVLPSEFDPAGYLYTRTLIEDGNNNLVLRGPIPLTCPVRLLHGMEDRSVPWQQSLRLAEQLQSTNVVLTLIKDGDHRLSRDQDLARLARVLNEIAP